MNANAKFILWLRGFFKKYGKIILIVFLVWLVMFAVNIYLKKKPKKLEAKTSYNPDAPIINEEITVPKKTVEKVNNTVQEYFNYCNAKQYELAFNMLTEECKQYIYSNNVNNFKEYIDGIFKSKKIYNIQNYSNVGNKYIYDIKILDDIAATGTTNNYEVYKDKLVLHDTNDGLKISNQSYVGKQEIGKETEDDNMKVKVLKKEMSYAREEYTLQIRNKIDNYIMISDEMGAEQVTLNLGTQKRAALNITNANIVILPGETKIVTLLFNKYYDDGVVPQEINFNQVRLLSSFSNQDSSGEISSEILRTYSLNINLK